MTKIRSQEHLEDVIDATLAWRKRELSVIHQLIRSNSSLSVRTDFLMRSGITLLYAHWEGFLKESGAAYLRYVATQGLSFKDLAPNFVALGMKSRLNAATQTNRASIYVDVAEYFLEGQEEKCMISVDDAINTQSNLNSAALKDITRLLGLDYSPYLTKTRLIDEQLLGNRNRVAHGKALMISLDEYLQIHPAVVGLLDLFRNQISNAAAMEIYKRVPALASI